MNDKTRITMDDSLPTAIVKLCEGNPGALTVLLKCVQQEPAIDPDSSLGNLGALFSFDGLGIYGPKIWFLYKNVCGSSIPRMIGLLRAHQLGFISKETLVDAVNCERERPSETVNIDSLLAQVKERLPKFNLEFPEGKPA